MIATRTPFRITLGGGGTDLPSFYSEHGGFILAMGVDKYMYVIVNPALIDRKIRLHYTQSETVDHVSELRHELAREALRLHGIQQGLEISSLADLPAGTGMGSSSCYLVGLLTALHHLRRDHVPLAQVAESACEIELKTLGKGIGKQDQYMAVFGGLTVLDIARDGAVAVRSVPVAAGAFSAFVANTHLYYTGLRRDALEVLADQNSALSARHPDKSRVTESLLAIKALGHRFLAAVEAEDYDAFGRLLHEHWELKKQLSSKISLDHVDRLYETVRRDYGVLGGKIVGAGGGGFLMLYCPRGHRRLEEFMLAQGMPRLHYMLENEGSKVVANFGSSPVRFSHLAAAKSAGQA